MFCGMDDNTRKVLVKILDTIKDLKTEIRDIALAAVLGRRLTI